MEYDFKRKPKAAVIAQVHVPSLGNQIYEHIAFSTEPWRDLEEFQAVRKFRDDLWRKDRRCMKTLDDYAQFAELFDVLHSLAPDARKYLKKHNGDLRRLRRDLCRAFKHGEAGLDNLSDMSARQFADALNDCGLEMLGVRSNRSDVENGLKAPFVPNTSPHSDNVLNVIGAFEELFPNFNRFEVLAGIEPKAMYLGKALTADCPFTDRLTQ